MERRADDGFLFCRNWRRCNCCGLMGSPITLAFGLSAIMLFGSI